ncbi:MAG: hypothetical protein AB7T49_17130 [Oligoflexales bacterium]
MESDNKNIKQPSASGLSLITAEQLTEFAAQVRSLDQGKRACTPRIVSLSELSEGPEKDDLESSGVYELRSSKSKERRQKE